MDSSSFINPVRHHCARVDVAKAKEESAVLLEACGSAPHWARPLQNLGHKPILLPGHATRRYVLRNKTDQADAKALLEASRNKDIKPVPVKSLEQQAFMTLHRLRSGWMSGVRS